MTASKIEAMGLEAIRPLLADIAYDGKVRPAKGKFLEDHVQQAGADLLLWTCPQTAMAFEVKATGPDKPTYPCMMVETVSNALKGLPGWYHLINPDGFVWVYLESNTAYLLKWKPFKEWLDQRLSYYSGNRITVEEGYRLTIGYKVPWDHISKALGPESFGCFDLNEPWDWKPKLETMGFVKTH